MLDTLRLNIQDYKICSDADLQVQPAQYNARTGESNNSYPLWRNGARVYEGAKAFHNSERCNVTVKPFSDSEPGKVLCMVQFSVPKVATDSNYAEADYQQAIGATGAIQKYLRDIGVNCNLKNADLSRTDLARTREVEETFMSYASVFKLMDAKRQQRKDLGTTFNWSNGQQETEFYDKYAEMKNRKADVSKLPVNSLRCEKRYKTAQKVRSALGMRTLGELLERYDELKPHYEADMRAQMFGREPDEISLLTVNGIRAELETFIERGDRYPFQNWIRAVALQRGIADFEAAQIAVYAAAPNRKTANQWRKMLKDAQLDANHLKIVAPSSRTIGSLYGELQKHFA